MTMLYLVIMAGGSGTRFWPESRRAKPKQFLTLAANAACCSRRPTAAARGFLPIERASSPMPTI